MKEIICENCKCKMEYKGEVTQMGKTCDKYVCNKCKDIYYKIK